MFWKARVENKRPASNRLVGVVMKESNGRFIVRFSLDDGSFFDVEGKMPRFDLGEIWNVSVHREVEVPTTVVEKRLEPLNPAD